MTRYVITEEKLKNLINRALNINELVTEKMVTLQARASWIEKFKEEIEEKSDGWVAVKVDLLQELLDTVYNNGYEDATEEAQEAISNNEGNGYSADLQAVLDELQEND